MRFFKITVPNEVGYLKWRLKKLRSYYFITKTQAESVADPDEIGNLIEEVVDLAKQINLEMDRDEDKELLDSHNHELTIDEIIEMHQQDIEELVQWMDSPIH
ncbi:hypothetical protein TNCV_584901 [Trichonephila clavipes]|nr:hypothetical protein TNCV_584901 [Trichonephila clavipes]